MSAQGYFADSDNKFINRLIVLLCENILCMSNIKFYYL